MQVMQVNNLIVGADCAVDFKASRAFDSTNGLSQLSYMENIIFLVGQCRFLATGQRFSWQGRLAFEFGPSLCLEGLIWANLISKESAICKKYIPEYSLILYRGVVVASMVAFTYFGYPLVSASFSIYTAIQFGFLGKTLQDFSATLKPYIGLLKIFVVETLFLRLAIAYNFLTFLAAKYDTGSEEKFSHYLTKDNWKKFVNPKVKWEINYKRIIGVIGIGSELVEKLWANKFDMDAVIDKEVTQHFQNHQLKSDVDQYVQNLLEAERHVLNEEIDAKTKKEVDRIMSERVIPDADLPQSQVNAEEMDKKERDELSKNVKESLLQDANIEKELKDLKFVTNVRLLLFDLGIFYFSEDSSQQALSLSE